MATMPITRVVLYKHGVGYFEREEDQSVSLAFELRHQVADRHLKLNEGADLQGSASGPHRALPSPRRKKRGGKEDWP
jgi:hypothetical protein